MMRALSLTVASFIAVACAPSSGNAEASNSAKPFEATPVATFNEPWAMTFVPGTPYALITEKSGKLKLWQADGPVRVSRTGAPPGPGRDAHLWHLCGTNPPGQEHRTVCATPSGSAGR